MNVAELRKLFGGSRWQAEAALSDRIEKREWKHNGRTARYAGIERKPRIGILVHFTVTESLPDSGCLHYRLKIEADRVIDCVSGNLNNIA